MSSPSSHAGILVPPPLIFAAGLIIGWLLHLWRPIFITAGSSTARLVAAAACIVIYLALFLGALRLFRRAGTSVIPTRPTTALVTGGVYRFTRNPLYVSMVALYVGIALLIDSWWPIVLLPVVVLVIDRAVIAREERYLASVFPAEYAAYRARVRRWL